MKGKYLISFRAILDSKVGSARVWASGVGWICNSQLKINCNTFIERACKIRQCLQNAYDIIHDLLKVSDCLHLLGHL